ncbi:MAG TPA: sigma-70 family RNA polymerase sigma factor [Candidatus Limnocylindria bacterium]|jgi:RNA polymerase sigma factor (sigma-70 family)|nr:sigma-70 family RNA polymerase sigma factor [Candidatus Limnocylindria bacterium]
MIDRWREVYEREYPRLLRALLAIGRDPAAAEDAAQEAFVKAHRTGLDNIEKLPAWLLVVGVREVFRKGRWSTRERELWASLPARNDGFDTATDRADLLAALGELPGRQRGIVVARYFYGLSYDEIAEHFDIKSGTVGATLHQAIERLRQIHLAGRLARGAMR